MVTMRWRRTEATAPDPRVAVVLAAAAAPTEPGAQPGEAAAPAAFRAVAPIPNRGTRMFPSLKAAAVAATATGVDKGAAISALASEGRSKAGLPHPTPTTTTTATTTKGADASSTGRSTAATASAGHSSTGTAHRP